MNEWMDEWLILKKKPACVHLRIIVYKIKAKDNIKKKNKQTRKTINSKANRHSKKATRQF